jgi:DNA-binding FrmR family transcriptional regulator
VLYLNEISQTPEMREFHDVSQPFLSSMKKPTIAAGFCIALMAMCSPALAGISIQRIIVPENSHPALMSAAKMLASDFSLPDTAIVSEASPETLHAGELLLTTNVPNSDDATKLHLTGGSLPADGYGIVFTDGAVRIYGQRPRSLLFAAGDVNAWRDQTSGTYARHPAFAFRSANVGGQVPVAECVARLGVNVIIGRSFSPVSFHDTLPEVYAQLSPAEQRLTDRHAARSEELHQRQATACHAADVDYYPLLYGNDFSIWSPELYAAAIKAYPSARGTNAANSWEKGSLCPSDSNTWKLVQAYVLEFIQRSHADGLYTTFWDQYGLYCQCDRCTKDGLNQFPDELSVCVSNYAAVARALNCKLIVRTWSSGAPHWLADEWVHAPGNGGPSGEATQLWAKAFGESPADVAIQTKVYASDCQPDPPFSDLLGHAAPHQEIAEYQITGQTTGRFYMPASTVDHTAWTMKRSFELAGPSGGVSLFCGATQNPRYNLFADIVNGINVFAWRELSWNPDAKVEDIWLAWARPIFGDKAAPAVVRALRKSESVINRLFSALGLGNDTNSGFAHTIDRREALLKYTNRYYRTEGQAALAPTLENVDRVIAEKEDCLRQIAAMQKDLDEAATNLPPAQLAELRTRLDWLLEFGEVERYLDESLWRYRYLRAQSGMLVGDAGQMKFIATAFDEVKKHYRRMFRFDPNQNFSCYTVSLGDLPMRPSLGTPLPLMTELYQQSLALVEGALGPSSVPAEWLRGSPTIIPPSSGANENNNENGSDE